MYSPKSLFNSDLGFLMSILFPEIIEQGVDRAWMGVAVATILGVILHSFLWGICKLFWIMHEMF